MAHATTRGTTHLSTALRKQSASLSAAARRAGRGDPEGIRRLRVTTRRLRAALKSMPEHDELGRDLRRLTKSLGRVRELDVARDLLREWALRKHWPASVVARVDQICGAERRLRYAEARREMRRIQGAAIVRRLRDAAVALERTATAEAATQTVARDAARVLVRAIANAGSIYEPSALHEVRLAAKKLRYAVELAGEPAPGVLRRLKALQRTLGSMHDLQVLQQRVRQVSGTDCGIEEMATLNAMVRTLEHACRRWHAKALRQLPEVRSLATRIAGAGLRPRDLTRPARMAASNPRGSGRRRLA